MSRKRPDDLNEQLMEDLTRLLKTTEQMATAGVGYFEHCRPEIDFPKLLTEVYNIFPKYGLATFEASLVLFCVLDMVRHMTQDTRNNQV